MDKKFQAKRDIFIYIALLIVLAILVLAIVVVSFRINSLKKEDK